jgi:hypothetical protein
VAPRYIPEVSWRSGYKEAFQKKPKKIPYVNFPQNIKQIIYDDFCDGKDFLDSIEGIYEVFKPTHVGAININNEFKNIGIIDIEKLEDGLSDLHLTKDYFFLPEITGKKLKITKKGGGRIRHQDFSNEIKLDFVIEGKAEIFWGPIAEFSPSFYDEEEGICYLAMTIHEGVATVLGVLRRTIHGPPDPICLHVGSYSIVESYNEMVDEFVGVDLTVHHSIMDRVGFEEVSIPAEFFKQGLLKEPFQVRFSSSVCKEIDVPDNTIFRIWLHSGWLNFSIKQTGFPIHFHRMRLEDSIRNGRISTKTLLSNLRENLAMKRTGIIDNNRVREIAKNYNDYSLYPKVILHSMMNHFPKEWDPVDGELVWSYFDDMAVHRLNILPLIVHLALAKYDLSLRGEVKTKSVSGARKIGRRNTKIIQNRKFDWGVDKIRYISPPKNNLGGLHPHWVRGHTRLQPVSRIEKIQAYRKKNIEIIELEGSTYAYIYISRYYKFGKGELHHAQEHYGSYFSYGRRPKNYSMMAIEWLKYIENNENVSIQHAVSGGEVRLEYEKGKWIFLDGFCEANNTVYEFHGDYWHGNPSIYNAEDMNENVGVSFGELYEKTISREELIKKLGYSLVTIWENDWNQIKD